MNGGDTGDDKAEHPAVQASRILKKLHQDTIDAIDKGQMTGELMPEIREQCEQQIRMCDKVIEAGSLRQMGRSEEAEKLLEELKELSQQEVHIHDPVTGASAVLRPAAHDMGVAPQADTVVPEDTELPQIGNFNHENETKH